MSTTATVGNDANLESAIMYAEQLLRMLQDARKDNAAGRYHLANARVATSRAAIAGLIAHLDTVHDDLVWRV